jgi:nuclear cap-binding protein subunit 1
MYTFNFAHFMKFYALGSLPGTAVAHELVMSIRRKCTPEEALNVLNTLPGLGETEENFSFNPLKIDVFVQTLLNLGSKSFSHSFAAIGKFHYVFKVYFSIIYIIFHPFLL